MKRAGLTIAELRASGGLPERNPFIMQVFADVTGKENTDSQDQPGIGGGKRYAGRDGGGSLASQHGRRGPTGIPARSRDHKERYDELYSIYTDLHGKFSDGVIMAKLRGGQ